MKSALLLCDEIPSDLAKIHGDYPTMYNALFPELNLEPFSVHNNEFPKLEAFDVFLIGGSKYSVYDDVPWILGLKDFLREAFRLNKKCLGICFGHQIIAEALGGKVERASGGFLIGVHNFKIRQKLDWMEHETEAYNVLMLCQDQVVQLPPKAEVLAGNPHCPIGMYRIGHTILCIQGHPEFSRAYNKAVFESRGDRISTEKINAASASLHLEPDRPWLQKVMLSFLKTPL